MIRKSVLRNLIESEDVQMAVAHLRSDLTRKAISAKITDQERSEYLNQLWALDALMTKISSLTSTSDKDQAE